MLKQKLRRLFFISLFISYFLALILAGIFFNETLSDLNDLELVKKSLSLLKEVSQIIIDLNQVKIYKITSDNLSNVQYIDKEFSLLLKKLEESQDIFRKCKCSDIPKLRKTILNLLQTSSVNGYQFVKTIDRYTYELNLYFLSLAETLKSAEISNEVKTFFFLYQQYNTLSNYVALNYLFLSSLNNNFYSEYSYLKGYFLANLQAFNALADNRDISSFYKENILKEKLVKNFLKAPYYNKELLIWDYKNFLKKFEKYNNYLYNHIKCNLNRKIVNLKLGLLTIIAAFIITLILIFLIYIEFYNLTYSNIEKFMKNLYVKSTHDSLTGLLTKETFNYLLKKNLIEKYKKGEKLSLILLDLDNFKKINDKYGHKFGDKVLKTVAQILKKNLKNDGLAFRWGGEEFVVWIKGDKSVAFQLAEKLRKEIENTSIDGIKITASFGVGEYKGEHPLEFFEKVDKTLYRAKQKGKNRVEIA